MNKSQRVSAKKAQKRALSTKSNKNKVAKKTQKVQRQSRRNLRAVVVGAAGGIGQPLSMLIKQNLHGCWTSLNVFDVNPLVQGVAADLSHIPTDVKVQGFTDLDQALEGADVVIIPAGVPRKPGMTRDDLFNTNAKINFATAKSFAKICPDAAACVISNPVNSMVPIWGEVLKANEVPLDNLFGVTTLDVFRATTFAAQKVIDHGSHPALYPLDSETPVLGGHAGTTIVPLFSKVFNTIQKPLKMDEEESNALYHRVAFGGDEVVQAKAGGGSATLSMAAAGVSFAESVALARSGMAGPNPKREYAFIASEEAKRHFDVEYFAYPIDLPTPEIFATIDGKIVKKSDTNAGKLRSEVHHTLHEDPQYPAEFGYKQQFFYDKEPIWANISPKEQQLIDAMLPDLRDQIKKGQDWAHAALAADSAPAAPAAAAQ